MERTTHIYRFDEDNIEYSITGTGTPILVFHGGHSNCHEEFGYAQLVQQGYSIITPSRAGYGSTSKEIGATLQTACEAYLNLLNHLQLDKVHVMAISAGGPTGITFAAAYPERVRSLTLQSAVTGEWLTPQDKEYKAAHIIFRPSIEKYTWKLITFLSSHFPQFIFKQMAASFTQLNYDQVQTYTQKGDIQAFQKMITRQRSGHGFIIDLSQTRTISESDLRAIQCPTLILHSKNDKAVSIQHAHHAHNHIPDSQLCILYTWGHLIWLGKGSDQLYNTLFKFLRQD